MPDKMIQTLALILFHQPVTLKEINSLSTSVLRKEDIDRLLNDGWIQKMNVQESANRPGIYGTTPKTLEMLGIDFLGDLPDAEELLASFPTDVETVKVDPKAESDEWAARLALRRKATF